MDGRAQQRHRSRQGRCHERPLLGQPDVRPAGAGRHLSIVQPEERELALVAGQRRSQPLRTAVTPGRLDHRPQHPDQLLAASEVHLLWLDRSHPSGHDLGHRRQVGYFGPRSVVGADDTEAIGDVLGQRSDGRVWVGSIERCPCADRQRFPHPDESPRAEAGLGVIGDPDRDHHYIVDVIVDRGLERDPGGAGPEGLEGGGVVADALGEHGQDSPGAQDPTVGRDGGSVLGGGLSVSRPIDGDDAGQLQQRPQGRDPEQRRLTSGTTHGGDCKNRPPGASGGRRAPSRSPHRVAAMMGQCADPAWPTGRDTARRPTSGYRIGRRTDCPSSCSSMEDFGRARTPSVS